MVLIPNPVVQSMGSAFPEPFSLLHGGLLYTQCQYYSFQTLTLHV